MFFIALLDDTNTNISTIINLRFIYSIIIVFPKLFLKKIKQKENERSKRCIYNINMYHQNNLNLKQNLFPLVVFYSRGQVIGGTYVRVPV